MRAGPKSTIVRDNGDHDPCDDLHDNSNNYVALCTSTW